MAEIRVFTSTDGHKIKAQILNVQGEQVEIKRSDGTKFKVDIIRFTEADRAYIKLWQHEKENPPLTSDSDLRVEANAVKNRKKDGSDYDNKTVEIFPSIKITNRELYAHYSGIQGLVLLLGKSAKKGDRTLKVLSREVFSFDLKPREVFEWNGREIRSSFDDNLYARFGHEYYGIVLVLKNKEGDVVYDKAPAQWLVDDIEQLEKLRINQIFKTKYK